MTNIYNFKNQQIGNVIERVFYSTRRPEHFMVKFNGFGISESILEQLKELDVKIIQINYIGKKGVEIFKCELDKYLNSKHIFTFEIGEIEDLQKFVDIDDMKMKKEPEKTNLLAWV